MPGPHEGVQLRFDRFLPDRGALQIEIEMRFVGGDPAPGHRVRHRGAQQVEAGVKAHVAMAPLPVDLGDDRGTRRRQRDAGRRDVDHLVSAFALQGVDDRDLAAAAAERAGVARLSAAGRVEHGLREPDAALVDPGHGRLAAAEIGVVAEVERSRHGAKFGESAARLQRADNPGTTMPTMGTSERERCR